MKKRWISTALCAAMVAGSLAGCGLKSPEQPQRLPQQLRHLQRPQRQRGMLLRSQRQKQLILRQQLIPATCLRSLWLWQRLTR